MNRKNMQRVLLVAVMVATLLLCCGFSPSRSAEFQGGLGKFAGGHQLDYVYYEPEGKGSYPLVIWLHGLGHGNYPGDQLNGNEIENWATPEYQSRFKDGGGAYILCPRSPEDKGVTWWSQGMEKALMALIESFIQEHPNVDTDRIYIGGFSLGGYMTIEMLKAYPDYFAAAFPVCPAVSPWESDLSQLADIPIWITTSTLDETVPYKVVSSFWSQLMEVSTIPGDCRISLLGQARGQDGRNLNNNHYSWYAVTSDMFTARGAVYYSMNTCNGCGSKVELRYPNGMISWLSAHSK